MNKLMSFCIIFLGFSLIVGGAGWMALGVSMHHFTLFGIGVIFAIGGLCCVILGLKR